MIESLQFLLNYSDIWVWQGLILLYGQSGFCCCRLVCFQVSFLCLIWLVSEHAVVGKCFFFSLPSIWSSTVYLYIYTLFHFFPYYDPFLGHPVVGNVFSFSPQSCHKWSNIYCSSFASNLELVQAYQYIFLISFFSIMNGSQCHFCMQPPQKRSWATRKWSVVASWPLGKTVVLFGDTYRLHCIALAEWVEGLTVVVKTWYGL
jgi:hypothetical protein